MTTLNATGRRMVMGTVGGLAILGLCSCSREVAVVDPTGGPTSSGTEQSAAPSEVAVDIPTRR